MTKKIIGFILSLAMCFTVLTGCNLFEHNTRKDYMQVVATIDSIEDEQIVDGEKIPFKSEKKNIYKYQLVNTLNQNASNYIQQGYSVEEVVKQFLEQLIISELVFIEADRMIAFKEIVWRDGTVKVTNEDGEEVPDYTDYNRVKELVYNSIDSTLTSIRKEILTEYDNDLPTVEDATGDSETTYPVKEEEKEDEEEIPQTEKFEPDKARWPGFYGDADTKALGRETMRRFIELLHKSANPENNFSVTNEDVKAFKKDDEEINRIINEQGIEYVYGMIYDTHYIEVLLKDNVERQVKLERVQDYMSKRVTVDQREVQERYNSMLEDQIRQYDADISAYNSAIKGGSSEILYTPSSKYFYVKHILLPFSDEQSARLKAKQNSGTYSDAEIKSYRDGLVSETVVYPHKDGENDLSRPMSVEQVFTQVKSAMKTVESDPYEAERLFDDFIYTYNTDPGIFNNAKGYIVENKLEDGESETYMKEFAEGARELYKNYKVGMVLDDYVVTDYGVHIMYLASTTKAGEKKKLSDYQTPGRYTTYYDIIEKAIRTERENKEFQTWQNNRISYYRNIKPIYKTYPKAYKDLYK